MSNYHGIIHFPRLFVPKAAEGSDKKKYNCGILMTASDPQVPHIQAEVDAAKLNSFPSGYTGVDCCFGMYEDKVPATKSYHDPRFIGWYLLTANAGEADKPGIADANRQQIIDSGAVVSGMMGWMIVNIAGYTTGRGGVAGYLNGMMLSGAAGEMGPMGRLDGKPSFDQLFASVGAAAVPQTVTPTATVPPIPGAVVAPPAPPAAVVAAPIHQMLPAANGATYDAMIAAGWNDDTLVQNGMMAPLTSF